MQLRSGTIVKMQNNQQQSMYAIDVAKNQIVKNQLKSFLDLIKPVDEQPTDVNRLDGFINLWNYLLTAECDPIFIQYPVLCNTIYTKCVEFDIDLQTIELAQFYNNVTQFLALNGRVKAHLRGIIARYHQK